MANYATLKAAIAAAIKENGNNEITGILLQQQLLAMVNSLGVGYQYAGIATPSTNPGTPDQNVFYLASTAGTYTNFNGIILADGEIAILKYNGAWSKDSTGAASLEIVNQFGQKFDFCNVNFQNGVPNTAYANAETARAAVPEDFRKYGLVIAYKLADGWHIEQYIYPYSVNPWVTASGWWKTYDYKPEYIVYNLNANYSLTEYTLADAIAAVPSEYRTMARAIIFRQTGVGTTLALFNTNAYISGWTNPDNWFIISPEVFSKINKEIGNNTQIIESILSNGMLVWQDGAFYSASTGEISTSIPAYSCSDKYPQHYYSFLSNKIEELFIASSWTQLSFWKDGVYAGYRVQNGYHLPNGTLVDSIDFDEFAINLSNVEIPDYRTSVVFVNFGMVFHRDFYALGDSTTAGVGSSQSPAKSWANYLNELATFPSFSKLAISGAFCVYHSGYGRLSAEIDNVPANTTGIVTIMIGTNDFFYDSPLGDAATALAASYSELNDTTNFANAFRYCIEKLKRKAPNAVIVVMQPLPSFDAGNVYGHLDETNLFAIRDIERTICNAMGIPIVETQYEFGLSRYTDNWNFFFSDFCHPNDTGYLRIAHCMLGKFIELCQ